MLIPKSQPSYGRVEMNPCVANKFLSFLVRVSRLLVWRVKPRVSAAPPAEFLDELPDDIIEDILSRLPLNSILQCRCVCKRWSRIIDDPAFIQVCSANKPSIFCLEYHGGHHCCTPAVHIVEDCYRRGLTVRKKIGMFPQLFRYRFRSTCNGMLYFDKSHVVESQKYWLGEYVTKRIVLNPITKRIVKLSRSRIHPREGFSLL